jgi:hypothetical protein
MWIAFNSRFGLQQFTEPSTSYVRPGAGLYAVLAADASATPRPFRVLYFGETGDYTTRLTDDHEHCKDWQNHTNQLYFAQLLMPGSTQQQRREIEQALIDEYTPPCNKTGLAASRYRASSRIAPLRATPFVPALPVNYYAPALPAPPNFFSSPAPAPIAAPPMGPLPLPGYGFDSDPVSVFSRGLGIAPAPVSYGAFDLPSSPAPTPIEPPPFRYRALRALPTPSTPPPPTNSYRGLLGIRMVRPLK